MGIYFFVCRKGRILLYLLSQIAGIAQLVERHLAKVNVAGSNPVSRSINAKVKMPTARREKGKSRGKLLYFSGVKPFFFIFAFFIFNYLGAVPKW